MIPEDGPDTIIDKDFRGKHDLSIIVKMQFDRDGDPNISRAYVKDTRNLWKLTASQSWRCGKHQRG